MTYKSGWVLGDSGQSCSTVCQENYNPVVAQASISYFTSRKQFMAVMDSKGVQCKSFDAIERFDDDPSSSVTSIAADGSCVMNTRDDTYCEESEQSCPYDHSYTIYYSSAFTFVEIPAARRICCCPSLTGDQRTCALELENCMKIKDKKDFSDCLALSQQDSIERCMRSKSDLYECEICNAGFQLIRGTCGS
jgi:hypothetical protein